MYHNVSMCWYVYKFKGGYLSMWWEMERRVSEHIIDLGSYFEVVKKVML